jgi:hypothetical protein
MLASIITVVLLHAVMGLCGRNDRERRLTAGGRTRFLPGALFSPLLPALSIVLALLPSHHRNNAVLPG